MDVYKFGVLYMFGDYVPRSYYSIFRRPPEKSEVIKDGNSRCGKFCDVHEPHFFYFGNKDWLDEQCSFSGT